MTPYPTDGEVAVGAATPPSSDDMSRSQRPHPLTPLIRGWLLLVAAVLGVGREFLPDGRGGGPSMADLRWLPAVLGGAVLLAAAAGFVSWWFTRFVIDDDEIRLDTGAVWRRSTRVAFQRLQSVDVVQPFAARPFGLVELRLDAGGGERALSLRYLHRAHADRLRALLLARVHGGNGPTGEPPEPQPGTGVGPVHHDTRLVTVRSGRLVGAFLLSTEWLVSAGVIGTLLFVGRRWEGWSFLIPAVIPVGLGAATLIAQRVVAMFHFTVAASPHGLRVTRGLTDLSGQWVPLDRVQGLRISQSLLWRPLGWFRIDVDVLGNRSGSTGGGEAEAATVLLPVADRAQVAVVLARVLPGVDLDRVATHRPPRRARLVRWFDAGTLRYGFDATVLVTEHGRFVWHRDVVAHAKNQSVRISQGPVQRVLGLADVHVDTIPGPVDAVARQLDAAAARALADAQVRRARAAVGP